MKPILVLAEDNKIAKNLVALGATLGDTVHAVVFTDEAAQALMDSALQKITRLQGNSPRPEDYAGALADLVRSQAPALVLVGDTIRGRELAAKTAALLQVGYVASASAIRPVEGGFETVRLGYGGAVTVTHKLETVCLVTISPASTGELSEGKTSVPVETLQVKTDDRLTVMETAPSIQAEVDLSAAPVVVGVGLGFNTREDLILAKELAQTLQGAIACTRPVAEDKGWLPVENYIGISGVKIKADLYFAIGISGQVQHLVGIREAKRIVAINKSKDAPIFKAADYGIVGDLYEVLPLLTEAIKKR